MVSSEHKPKDVLKSLCSYFVQYQFGSLHSVKSVESEILLRLERSYRVNAYKFGVLYCRDGQTDENDMFANTLLSKDYENFLGWLGEEITLEGWNRFRGGLDVASKLLIASLLLIIFCSLSFFSIENSTGLRSVFTTYRSYEIMFHVATMLPYQRADEQQLERKRHLGNDVVLIVYKEGQGKFNPLCIHSEFNHVFIVVQKLEDDSGHYRVEVVYKGDIPLPSVPLLPENATFALNNNFRMWLLAKCKHPLLLQLLFSKVKLLTPFH